MAAKPDTAERKSDTPSRLRTPFGEKVSWGVGLLGGASLLLAVWYLRYVLLLMFAGVLLAVLLRAPADWLEARVRLPARAGVGMIAVVIALSLVGAIWLRGGAIAEQVTVLREQLPSAVTRLERAVQSSSLGRALLERVEESREELVPEVGPVVSRATGVLSSTVGALASGLLLLFVGLVLALSPSAYTNGVIQLVAPHRRARARHTLTQLGVTLRWWLLGRLLSMAIVGVLTGIGLALLGIPLAFLLALIAALLSFVPNIGPIISAVPAVLLGFVDGADRALAVVALYIGVQLVETNLLQPVIERKTVSLLPGLTVLTQLAFGVIAGIGGLALASPLTAVTMVLVREVYVRRLEEATDARTAVAT